MKFLCTLVATLFLSSCAHQLRSKIPTENIHSSCDEVFGSYLTADWTYGTDIGIACMEKIVRTGSEAQQVLARTQAMVAQKTVKFHCDKEDLRKISQAAAKVYPPDDGVLLVGLNPAHRKVVKGYFAPILFHELLHLTGSLHGGGIEYSYACEECCFWSNKTTATSKLSCEICSGKFNDWKSPDYARAIATYASYRKKARKVFLLAYMGRKILVNRPRSQEHLKLTLFESDQPEVLGTLWAQHLLNKKVAKGEFWQKWARAKIPDYATMLIPTAKRMVEIMDLLYVKGNVPEAIKLLGKTNFKELEDVVLQARSSNYPAKAWQELAYYLSLDLWVIDVDLKIKGLSKQRKTFNDRYQKILSYTE